MKLIVFLVISLYLNHLLADDCEVPEECYRMDAEGEKAIYSGIKRTLADGTECQRWDSQEPHGHTRTNPARYDVTNLSYAENFCRDPDSSGFPWCYSMNETRRWETCGVPTCPEFPVKPCPNFDFNCCMYTKYWCNMDSDCEADQWCCFMENCNRNLCVTPMT